MILELDDNSEMPFGKHKGKEMVEVPASYLLWYWNENESKYTRGLLSLMQNSVMRYINENMDALKLEIKKK